MVKYVRSPEVSLGVLGLWGFQWSEKDAMRILTTHWDHPQRERIIG